MKIKLYSKIIYDDYIINKDRIQSIDNFCINIYRRVEKYRDCSEEYLAEIKDWILILEGYTQENYLSKSIIVKNGETYLDILYREFIIDYFPTATHIDGYKIIKSNYDVENNLLELYLDKSKKYEGWINNNENYTKVKNELENILKGNKDYLCNLYDNLNRSLENVIPL